MTYVVKEVFDTLQGEGARAGSRSVFVRFTGCNLWNGRAKSREEGKGACAKWCDTDFAEGVKLSGEELLKEIAQAWRPTAQNGVDDGRWIVATGGEPLLQLDEELVRLLHANGIKIAIETNGTIESTVLGSLDWVCVSPKLGNDGLSTCLVRNGHELKVVLPGGVDVYWTDNMLEQMRESTSFQHYYVQPQDPIDEQRVDQTFLKRNLAIIGPRPLETMYKDNLKQCIDFVRAHPQWKLSSQMHKYLGLQ